MNPTVLEHLSHMTDGRWHDDCPYCLNRRETGGTGVEHLDPAHKRESATPMEDGSFLADCSCGGTYSVPQGGDEYGKLERAHRKHVAKYRSRPGMAVTQSPETTPEGDPK